MNHPKRFSKETWDQSIKLIIIPKIIAKMSMAMPISKISSKIGPPFLFFNLKLFNIRKSNILVKGSTQGQYLNSTKYRKNKMNLPKQSMS